MSVRIIIRRRPAAAAATGLALALAAAPAAAHVQDGIAGGLADGLLHPVQGVDHLVAMVAVGLWGAQLGPPLIVALPVVFPLVMALGALAGVAGVALPFGPLGVALSALALGLAVAFAWRPSPWVAAALVAVFAIFHGHAHGLALPGAVNPLAYGLGFLTATGLLHLAGILIGLAEGFGARGGLVVRAAGGLVALVGLWASASAAGLAGAGA